jgi:tRNA(Ile2) C34 agmatinyltransferase TiaS
MSTLVILGIILLFILILIMINMTTEPTCPKCGCRMWKKRFIRWKCRRCGLIIKHE